MSTLVVDQDLTDISLNVNVEEILSSFPPHDERRKILARDSFASVDGFRTLVLAAYEYLFGLRVCLACPDCNNGEHGSPCQDLFGSNAFAEGGIVGRIDAGYTSIEAQKSTGSLHAHSQLFVQCLHQHTPLAEIMSRSKHSRGDLVKYDLEYKERVCRQVYARVDADTQQRLVEVEKTWPEYVESNLMISRPDYLTRRSHAETHTVISEEALHDAKTWVSEYLDVDVQNLQEHKQNHVHVYNEETGSREPLQACRRMDKPKECKA